MKRCVDEGTLQAYLDGELEEKATRAAVALCVEKADGILTLERQIRRLAAESD